MANKKVISLDQNGEHYYRQGIKKRQQNNKKDALQLLKKAHDKNPDNTDYLSEYVYVMAENGFGNEAEHLVIEAFVNDDYSPEYFYILSQINIIKHDANKAFLYGVLSGIVEPIGALLTIALTSLVVPTLPYFLAFAAGTMIYVVVEELIPESQSGEHSNIGTIGVAIGFVIMMILDIALG